MRKDRLAPASVHPYCPAMTTPAIPRTASGPDVEKGMLIMVLAMLMAPGMDALAKSLAATVPPGQVAWGRFVFQTIFLLPAVLTMRRKPLRRLHLHAARGALLAGGTLLFFWAVKYLPLADAIALFFVEPLVLTLFSALFLGEPIGWRRMTAVAVGFGGALVVIRPSWEIFGPAALLPLGTAVCLAGYLVLTRHLARWEGAGAMQLWAGIFGTAVLSLALAIGAAAGIDVVDPVWPSAWEWMLLTGIGLLSAITHLLVVFAFRRAPAGVLAPFHYLEIISATLLGLLIFGEFPNATTWVGVAIVVGSGLYVFHRERRLARTVMPPGERP
jgi:S-adenosylmethionine uptake transporter